MAPRPELSGVAVAMATAGAFLIYAGFRGIPLREALREITSGQVQRPRKAGPGGGAAQEIEGIAMSGHAGRAFGVAGLTGAFPELAQEALTKVGSRYSQAQRYAPGVYDCSSLVQRSFKALGISDCPSVTWTQLPWKKLQTISRSEVGAGDIVFYGLPPSHVVIAISNDDYVGADNPRVGVRTGAIESGSKDRPIICKRYVGARPGGRATGEAGRPVSAGGESGRRV